MAPPKRFLRPDVLVLAGGGVVGEAWMQGVLAGIEDAASVDLRDAEAFVGTSAGSIVGARLAAGRRPPRPKEATPEELADEDPPGSDPSLIGGIIRGAGRWGFALTAPVAGAAVALGTPVTAVARAALLSRAGGRGRPLTRLHERVARWGAGFDGRLRVCAVDRHSGRRVVFGAPGAPAADVPDAVCASCAIPWVFRPVTIGGREYVDGGAWSVTNLDAAPAGRGTHVLCLDPVAGGGGLDHGAGPLRGAVRLASGLEIAGLRRRGARVLHVPPDREAARAMGPNLMAFDRLGDAHASGYRQGLGLGAG